MSLIIAAAFFGFMILGVPIAFSLGLAGLVGINYGGLPSQLIVQKMLYSVDSFPFMAIPLFMLAGEILVGGGLMERLIGFANALVGRVRGGLAQVAVLSGVGLASVSGTAVADATALSSVLIQPMRRVYGMPFSAAVLAASANLGPIIPPSTAMIIYATVAANSVSIAALFAGGIVPGLLIAVMMMVVIWIIAIRRGYPLSSESFRLSEALKQGRRAIWALLMPIVVIGGILGGVFTATESAAIAVVYAFLVGTFVTRQLKLRDLPEMMLNAAITTAVVGALIAFAATVTYLLTIDLLPQRLTDAIALIADSRISFMLLVMSMLIVVGMFIEPAAAYIMLVPILAPLAANFGVHPVHFAVVFGINVAIGVLTPPVGTLLFVMCGITRLTIWQLFREIWPLVLVQYAVMFICLFLPDVVLWLPRLLGH